MAATPLRRLTRAALAIPAALVIIVVGYLLAAWIGSSIPQNSTFVEAEDGIEIMVETNGTHTGIVMPVQTDQHNWRQTFPSALRPTSSGAKPTHIAIGFGEREVFLDVPNWSDMRMTTALRIAVLGGDPVIRVSHYVRPVPSENYRPMRISRTQYRRLVSAIEAALPPEPASGRTVLTGTFAADAYYEARGRYSMGNTCNSWVGARLADAGIEIGLWTPLAGGVMKWIPEPAHD